MRDNKCFELSDDDLAQVIGGTAGGGTLGTASGGTMTVTNGLTP